MIKPTIPSGTRDFSPEEVYKRQFIFTTIRSVFEKYGYQPIETPTMENLSTLEGKYGEEGDRLLFRIIESGDIPIQKIISRIEIVNKRIDNEIANQKLWEERLSEIRAIRPDEKIDQELSDRHFFQNALYFLKHEIEQDFKGESEIEGKRILPINKELVEKGLRYDLTVPFARYVVMHQNEITFPFKRYQIQPVYRADRPQRGRYREFFQCDADVVGSDSLLNEVELIQIYVEVFKKLGMDVGIRINNRKILSGIAERIGARNRMIDLATSMDKYDKGGLPLVAEEMRTRNFTDAQINSFKKIVEAFMNEDILTGQTRMEILANEIKDTADGLKGVEEMDKIMSNLLVIYAPNFPDININISLARGLNYYTGTIIEVNSKVGTLKSSIGGGGRYDDLTEVFGLKGVSGVGISFGADRIYDVMEELKLFPKSAGAQTRILFVSSSDDAEKYSLQWIKKVRDAGFAAEIYPFEKNKKDPKHIKYALSKKIPLVAFVDEKGIVAVRNMETREQKEKSIEEIIQQLK